MILRDIQNREIAETLIDHGQQEKVLLVYGQKKTQKHVLSLDHFSGQTPNPDFVASNCQL